MQIPDLNDLRLVRVDSREVSPTRASGLYLLLVGPFVSLQCSCGHCGSSHAPSRGPAASRRHPQYHLRYGTCPHGVSVGRGRPGTLHAQLLVGVEMGSGSGGVGAGHGGVD